MPTYYNNTDICYKYNNLFVSTTTEILTKVHSAQVSDVGVIFFEDCRHMFHITCVTKLYGLETIKCPSCDSGDSYVDCQSYDEQINIFLLLFLLLLVVITLVTIIMLLTMIIITMMVVTMMRITMMTITMMLSKLMTIKMYVVYVKINFIIHLLKI